MPLHLLGKKSWNVYNQDNVARVKRDEAAAAAREAAEEQSMQEADARRRMRVLLGEPTLDEPEIGNEVIQNPGASRDRSEQELGLNVTYGDAQRSRKRRRGENDTDRDIRYARKMTEPRQSLPNSTVARIRELKSIPDNAVLEDSKGNFDLFPEQRATESGNVRERQRHDNRNRKDRRHKDERDQRLDYDGTMRFSDAGGRSRDAADRVWNRCNDKANDGSEDIGKDVWGNDDPNRRRRDAVRTAADDPLAAMTKGVQQVRRVESARRKWRSEQAAELESLRHDEEHHGRRGGRHREGRHHKTSISDDDVKPLTLKIRSEGIERTRRFHREQRSSRSRHRR